MVAKNGSVSKTNIKNDYFDKFGEPETKIFGQFWFWYVKLTNINEQT